eukprot:365494-Chlamydomonas_euryale.AAC.5
MPCRSAPLVLPPSSTFAAPSNTLKFPLPPPSCGRPPALPLGCVDQQSASQAVSEWEHVIIISSTLFSQTKKSCHARLRLGRAS